MKHILSAANVELLAQLACSRVLLAFDFDGTLANELHLINGGKISEEWAGADFTAFRNTTGTYKAPWIP